MIRRILKSIKLRINNKLNPKSELDILREIGLSNRKNFNFFNSNIDYGHCCN